MKSPAISIVMPVYNGLRFLPAQLDSILTQSFSDFELIIIDDASSDGSVQLLQEYARRDSRIQLVCHKKNHGLLNTLAIHLPLTQAPWIALSDQDDIWAPQKLECLMQNVTGYAAAYSNSALINEHGAELGIDIMEALQISVPASGHDPFELLHRNCVSGHALLFHRELLPHFLPFSSKKIPYDNQIGIAALTHGGLVYCPKALVKHRLHQNNQCNNNLLAAKKHNVRTKGRTPGKNLLRWQRRQRTKIHMKLEYFAERNLVTVQALLLADPCRFDKQWFDLPLFWLVLRYPLIFTKHSHTSRLRLAYETAKGARWYHSKIDKQRKSS